MTQGRSSEDLSSPSGPTGGLSPAGLWLPHFGLDVHSPRYTGPASAQYPGQVGGAAEALVEEAGKGTVR